MLINSKLKIIYYIIYNEIIISLIKFIIKLKETKNFKKYIPYFNLFILIYNMYINYHLVKKINKKLIEKSNIYKKINFS